MSCLSYELKNPNHMKTIKVLMLLVAFSAATFYSCSDENSINTETNAQKSIALRTVLNQLKKDNAAGRSAVSTTPPTSLCFEFVFPLTFTYNNGTAITASNLVGLLAILNNESPSLHLDGIVFPFQVQASTTVQTIADEGDLIALIVQCGLPTFNDDLQFSYCFDIEFPIQIATGGQIVTIHSQTELNTYLSNPNSGVEAQIVYPISVINQNQTIIIHNVFEFYDIVNSCNVNECICTLEYMPVCVNTPNGTVEFSNFCFASCAGFTQADIVQCPVNPNCTITSLSAVVGDCTPTGGSYQLTINFEADTNANQFEVWTSGGTLLGTYQLGLLPLTLDYPMSLAAIPSDSLTIRISETCTETITWTKPLCNCICTTEVLPVCVQTANGLVRYGNTCLAACDGYTPNDFVTCYNFGEVLGSCFSVAYPVYVQSAGALVTISSDAQLRQYWQPTVGPMPIMNYPITVIFANTVYTFANQAEFENQINISCP